MLDVCYNSSIVVVVVVVVVVKSGPMDWAIFSTVDQPKRFAHGAFASLAFRMEVETVNFGASRASVT